MEELALNMFQAGSNLKGKSAEEICFQDFKQFTVNDVRFGVGLTQPLEEDNYKKSLEEMRKKGLYK